jgi:hypothetical protein
MDKQFAIDAEQNAVIKGLAGSMGIVGWGTILAGIANGVLAVLSGEFGAAMTMGLAVAVLMLAMGNWLVSGARSLDQVRTNGNDVRHLIDGLGSLRSYFGAVAIVMLVCLALVAIVALFGWAIPSPLQR